MKTEKHFIRQLWNETTDILSGQEMSVRLVQRNSF